MPLVALVDDDTIFQFTATRLIQSAKLAGQIISFENGGDAINYLKENAANIDKLPDHLFLDINMPFIDGWMFLEDFVQLKSKLVKDIRIYMVSSSIDQRDMNRAKEYSEVKEFVVKPVSMETFSRLLQRVA
jgi:two-component system, chemotaxis family, chemotaxis protein CheY